LSVLVSSHTANYHHLLGTTCKISRIVINRTPSHRTDEWTEGRKRHAVRGTHYAREELARVAGGEGCVGRGKDGVLPIIRANLREGFGALG
jgi:hypothetical protein